MKKPLLSACLLLFTTMPDRVSGVGPEFRVEFKNGRVARVRLEPDLSLSSRGFLDEVKSLTAIPAVVDSSRSGPLRILNFWTGERIAVHVDGIPPRQQRTIDRPLEARKLLVRNGRNQWQIPLHAIDSLRSPVQTAELAWSGEPARPGFWTNRRDGTLERRLSPPVSSVCVQISPRSKRREGWLIRFRFAADGGEQRSFEIAASETDVTASLPLRTGRRSWRIARPDQTQIRLQADDGLTVSINGRILARHTRTPGRLAGIEVASSVADQPSVEVRRDDDARLPVCLILGRAAARPTGKRDLRQYSVGTTSSILFGESVKLGESTIELATVFRPLQLSWREVHSIQFPHPSRVELRRVSGSIADVELQPELMTSLFGREESQRVRVALQRAAPQGLEFTHAFLNSAADGPLVLPWSRIHRVRPLFQGSTQLLDTGPRHLGNGIRASFSIPQPAGTELRYAVHVEDPASAGQAFLSAEICELEAAGPEAPAASPRLEELRDGFLVTECLVNGTSIGNWNELVKLRRVAGDFERLRLSIPKKLLLPGRNSITIRQHPARDDRRSFDDFEFRNLALEFESP